MTERRALTLRVVVEHDDPEIERSMAEHLRALAAVLGLQVVEEPATDDRPGDPPAAHRDA